MEDEMNDEQFVVDTEEKADWVIKKMTAIEDEKKRLQEQHATRIKQLDNDLVHLRLRFMPELERWVSENLPKNRKSIDLPHGRIGFRKTRAKIDVLDKKLAIDWAKKNCPDAVAVSERIRKTPLQKSLATTGELPDGCRFVPESNKFYLK